MHILYQTKTFSFAAYSLKRLLKKKLLPGPAVEIVLQVLWMG